MPEFMDVHTTMKGVTPEACSRSHRPAATDSSVPDLSPCRLSA